MMKVLVIGSGAREHAIAKALAKSPQTPEIFCYATSNNPGIMKLSKQYKVGNLNDIKAIAETAKNWKINFTIVGPEAPLERGLADILWDQKIPVIGPKKSLARIESSKSFTRNLLQKYHIPGSPEYKTCYDLKTAKQFLHDLGEGNYVIKADGLMSGKGVKVAGDHLASLKEAFQFCEELFSKQNSFIIEEKCIGEEFSLMCFSDGNTLAPMPLVQDHKRAYVFDKGPNTGGMGSYSDANHRLPFLQKDDIDAAMQINLKVLDALNMECQDKYIGILYGSFMATEEGVKLIEYNARFGDPEAMNVLSLLESDFVSICKDMISGKLNQNQIEFQNLATVCKYLVPEGYPDHPIKDSILDISQVQDTSLLYFAAVDAREGQLYATGSRTVAVVGMAETIAAAEQQAEEEIKRIKGKLFHRPDIGTEELIQRRVQHMRVLRQCTV